MGKKTSVYLSDDLAERIRASGLSLAELLQRGLDTGHLPPAEAAVARMVDEWGERILQRLDSLCPPPGEPGGGT